MFVYFTHTASRRVLTDRTLHGLYTHIRPFCELMCEEWRSSSAGGFECEWNVSPICFISIVSVIVDGIEMKLIRWKRASQMTHWTTFLKLYNLHSIYFQFLLTSLFYEIKTESFERKGESFTEKYLWTTNMNLHEAILASYIDIKIVMKSKYFIIHNLNNKNFKTIDTYLVNHRASNYFVNEKPPSRHFEKLSFQIISS